LFAFRCENAQPMRLALGFTGKYKLTSLMGVGITTC